MNEKQINKMQGIRLYSNKKNKGGIMKNTYIDKNSSGLWRANWNEWDWKRLVYRFEIGEITKTEWLQLHKFIHSIQLDATNEFYIKYLKKMYLNQWNDLSTEADYSFARCMRLTGSAETARSWKIK